MAERWIILRCAGRSTLKLAKTLGEDGFEVWAPAKTIPVEVRGRYVRRNITKPIMDGYVFANADHLHDLLAIERMPVKPRRGKGLLEPAHDDFTLFRFNGGIRGIEDASLEPLRRAEAMAVPKRRRSKYAKGSAVRVKEGPLGGMSGTVERSDGQDVVLWLSIFGRTFRAKIPTFLLHENESSSAASQQSRLDKAA